MDHRDFSDCCILCRALNMLDEDKMKRLTDFYGLTPMEIAAKILSRGILSLEADMDMTEAYTYQLSDDLKEGEL